MKVVAIIQARMGSTRLPGKVLKKVLDKPLLEYQIERVKRSKLIDEIVIATTTNEADELIIDFCERLSISYYRGSENDVLSRYYEAANIHKADVVVRLTSDCPVIDPVVIDTNIQYYLDNQTDFDYVSNTHKRTFPRGFDTEVFSFDALEAAFKKAELASEKEHVTPYIYQNPSQFRIGHVFGEDDHSDLRLTVDTKEDFLLIEKIIDVLYKNNPNFTYDDIVKLLNENKDWLKINAEIKQKKV
ncbi:cytidylyltransferase domain-containing protein [Saliterribacillus persicus]|uniref:Spore coat polysaccharide biosynthesis protein SpsF n=1 Tax=Saliterribacillus persicus TaxID=930114 RepID=A0A368YCF9_9BACI|nr:glycosyltransferase family protein [Saliterribacillus persicus]RCW77359.1 spore coat polysaccharide biosynthesis protein SpsF [Saliterribacillus persicus]